MRIILPNCGGVSGDRVFWGRKTKRDDDSCCSSRNNISDVFCVIGKRKKRKEAV